MEKNRQLRINRAVSFVEKPPYPQNMLIALNNICNHECVFCLYKKSNTFNGRLNNKTVSIKKDFLFSILTQAYKLGTREVGFYMISEPFTSALLCDAVQCAKEIGFDYVYITTNGSLATDERITKVYQAGLDSIKFSVNGADRDSYKRIHGKDDFNKVIENIKNADRLRKEINPKIEIYISFAECLYSKGTGSQLKQMLLPYIDDFRIYSSENVNGVMYEELGMKIVAPCSIKCCDMIFNRFHVTPDEFLTACCNDADNMLVFADLSRISLKDAWYNDKIIKLRRQFLNSNIDKKVMCYNCINNTNNKVTPLMFLD
jgi:hypothetical protein